MRMGQLRTRPSLSGLPLDAAAISSAQRRIRRYLFSTPLVRVHHFSSTLNANVYFKLETLQPTHSFKVRGAFNALTRLSVKQKRRGVVTASGGNHGLAVAYAARLLGIPACIYLPHSASPAKLVPLRRLGPEVVVHGASWDDANALAQQVARDSDRAYIHPFDDLNVMAGQATIGLEIARQLPSVNCIVASIGGGGLISGIACAARHFLPQARVVGVETKGADSMYRSLQAGRIVELPAITSIAETLGARKTRPMQFETVSRHVHEVVVVTDDAAITALRQIAEEEKLLAEPAASCSVAALTTGKVAIRRGEDVVVVLCGANVSRTQFREWTSRE
jgi:threonine dehydratase